jgi:hypothetical protein
MSHLALAALALPLALPPSLQTAPPQAQRQPVLPPAEDCNGNGIADVVEIASGSVEDCQGDGIPDECQVAVAALYTKNDAQMNGSVGTQQRHVAWLTHHTVRPGHEVVTDFVMAWGYMAGGTPATLGIWTDPDGDGDPADAQLIMEHVAFAQLPQSGIVVDVDVPDTYIGPAGTSFFIGAFGEFEPEPTNYPAALDDNSLFRESWWITSTTPIDPNALATGGIVEYGLIGQFIPPYDGDWMLTALTCPGGHCGESADLNANGRPDECEDCNGNGLPDDLDIAQGAATDCDGDSIPDLCNLPDCDANGLADLCQASAPFGLAGEYFNNKTLQGTPLGRIDAQMLLDFGTTPPFPNQITSGNFSARWTGSIRTTVAGTYTFGIDHSRGVRMWINGQLVIYDWWDGAGFDTGTIDLAADTEYFIRIEYFSEGNGHLDLQWQPPGGSMAPIPVVQLRPILDRDLDGIPDNCQFADCNANGVEDPIDVALGTAFDCDADGVLDQCQACGDCDGNGWLDSCEPSSGNGLVARYWASYPLPGNFTELFRTQLDTNIDFDWGQGAPLPLLPADKFSARWSGKVVAPQVSGTYRITVAADDGVRLWLDGTLVLDEWHSASGNPYDIDLFWTAGSEHSFRLDYYESGGDARLSVRWTVPGQPEVAIPTSAFRVDSDANGDGFPDLCGGDCNLNGIPDVVEVQGGTLADANGNCLADLCETGAGYWRFEEAGGSTVLDASGNGLSGTLNSLPLRISDVPTPLVPLFGRPNGQALDLNWQSVLFGGVATVPDLGGWMSFGGQSFTLEAWVKLDTLSSVNGFGSLASSNERQWLFMKKPGSSSDSQLDYGLLVQGADMAGTGRELLFRYGDGTTAINLVSSLRIEDLDWHFVSFSFDSRSSEARFGLDGIFETVGLGKPDLVNGGALVIGAHENQSGTKNQFLRGSIDEVRVSRLPLPPEALLDATSN